VFSVRRRTSPLMKRETDRFWFWN